MRPSDVDALFRLLDTNGSGVLTKDELGLRGEAAEAVAHYHGSAEQQRKPQNHKYRETAVAGGADHRGSSFISVPRTKRTKVEEASRGIRLSFARRGCTVS